MAPLLIGISARIYYPQAPVADTGGVFTRTLHYLEQSVAHWVLKPHVLALMIPAIEREGLLQPREVNLADYARQLDGLVLQGGNDVSPRSYGEDPMHADWTGDRIRDRYEIELFRAFLAAGKPVIGICRGCQLINVALGGTLYQDIPTQLPEAIGHRDLMRYDQQFHDIELTPGSRLSQLYGGATHGEVNSIHHQAVKDLGEDLVVEARGVPDGVVEAVRWRGSSYVFGMQWHPEFMAGDAPDPRRLGGDPILLDFLSAVAERKERR
ncbi:gamma-glutamyl-gamma-aminobutyrate hydrolase family protein [Azohydromonas caseinilytica]|uniref:Gamma-glutamyl-gamma-aminobutyrate hydrolase family protein n=1 Tax=Azohydromonas caseinilytica TaxID=2728836 RepID=A0A848F6K5_9BURK|nr:gamma-glutamyl-gamma-aminobutyrate hydrolase family protein [Azohydromonas caseinilytica]NML13983.1 gamma-glutamyl-gamma-aminobutyrate hydrolase family protein [Azohydromonas caseinilytica]